ncbi:hypothetical protein D3C79_962100 [compost metagenome]
MNEISSLTPSKSQPSWGVLWKCHLIVPSSGLSARREEEYRLSPGRRCEFHGAGLPVPNSSRLVSGS